MKVLNVFLSAFAAVALVAPASAVIVIDDYDSGAGSGSITSGSGYFFQNGTMIGGDRLTYLNITGNQFGLSFDVDAQAGVMSLTKQSGVAGIGQVRYGYMPSGQTSAFQDMNWDFSGENQFCVTVLANDLAGMLRLRLRSSSANGGTFMISNKNIAGGINTPTVVTWDYSEFAGMDFTDIDQVVLEVATAEGGDITFDNLKAVPEPTTMIALGAGAALLAARRKKKA